MKRKGWYFLIGTLIILGSLFFTIFLVKSKPVPQKNKTAEHVLNIKAMKVNNHAVSPAILYKGRVNAFDNVALASEVSGRIKKGDVDLREGQSFRKGVLLVEINKNDMEEALKSGKSNFLRTLSEILPDLSVDYPEEYAKWKTFFNAIDVNHRLPVLPRVTSEKEQIYLASKGVLADYYSLRQQEFNLDKYQIYAPFDGSFKEVKMQVGAVAGMGSQLATIIRTDRLEITVPVLPADARSIQVGDEVNLYSNSLKNQTGVVQRVADFVDASTQSVNVYVTYLPGNHKGFMEGEFVNVEFTLHTPQEGIRIPREALLNNNRVYCIEGARLKTVNVQVIGLYDDYVVVSGISDDALVVIESVASVSANTRINPIIKTEQWQENN
ncbi:HlyD family efflux transporter periplasmic adaptor subunit [Marinilabiliaceae bacterium JC017]|nr:HlyD family efflux transporter periplasmic adaptor subunit [Marinilabiliaceae bacterium JC017]